MNGIITMQSNLPERETLYNKSLLFPLMNSAYNFNLYIRATAHKGHIFR
jgi:hypothetical protein